MPSRLVLEKFRKGKLRSGNKRTGPIVRNPAQARAIQISEARAEGHDIPYPHHRSRSRKSSRRRGKRSRMGRKVGRRRGRR
jgi:hypothetical protein